MKDKTRMVRAAGLFAVVFDNSSPLKYINHILNHCSRSNLKKDGNKMRTIRIKLYAFSELSKETQETAINDRIQDMLEYEHQDHYDNWPEYKAAIDRADEMQTPWFAGSYVWDYCKEALLADLNEREFTQDGKPA